MRTATPIAVKSLHLDLGNYRTVRQKSEQMAIHAMITIKPDRFWAVAKSLLEDGYSPTENIIVLKDAKQPKRLVVKEGNRRIAALKLILKQRSLKDLDVPKNIADAIEAISEDWKRSNASVPCLVFEPDEEAAVDDIVSRVHGKGDKAARDPWLPVARARHNRDKNDVSEPGLDILDQYLKTGSNLTPRDRELWAGTFHLTILDEAITKLVPLIGSDSSKALAQGYAKKGDYRTAFEKLLLGIGERRINFEILRQDAGKILRDCGFPIQTADAASDSAGSGASTSVGSTTASRESATEGTQSAGASAKGTTRTMRGRTAYASNDPRSIRASLKSLKPTGRRRAKLVTILQEAALLDVSKTPHAFCFALRCLFELSARAYCEDHAKSGGPSFFKANGQERHLAEVLREIERHLTSGGTDKQREKELHGAMIEIDRPRSPLSVTSLNQLIHGQVFSMAEQHISTVFHNLFPLLEAMNS